MYTIALVGRTNVGKSTLFNRILGEGRAIASELPHTTRDRIVGTSGWRGIAFRLIDTGGVEHLDARHGKRAAAATTRTIEEEIRMQAERTVQEADCIVLVTDVRDGLLPGERAIAQMLRALGRPVVIACNKAETKRYRDACHEFTALGFGAPFPVSAKSGMGVGDLLDGIVAFADSRAASVVIEDDEEPKAATRVAIVGEPNVGKSSLVNAILGWEEVIVSPEPYTTRDVHDVTFAYHGTPIVLLDTAGIRRAAMRTQKVVRKRLQRIERESVGKSLHAVERADVAVLVLDATRPASRHVKQLAQAIVEARRACIIVINKMDEAGDPDEERIVANVRRLFPHMAWAPVLLTSAVTGTRVRRIIPVALAAVTAWRRELDSEQLAAVYATTKHRIPEPKDREGQRQIRTIDMEQVGTAPPQFVLRTRRRVRLPQAIPGIVERAIRETDDFTGTPVIVFVKGVKV
ncbi:MAG: ribosome biogenesis GTPase Der [bacterium]|nr:ribosome biogenesis GTPase Der [bacterium]